MPNNDRTLQKLVIHDFSPGIKADARLSAVGVDSSNEPNFETSKPGEALYRTSVGGTTYFTAGVCANPDGHLVLLPSYLATGFAAQPVAGDTFLDVAGLATVYNNTGVGSGSINEDLILFMHVLSNTPKDTLRVYRGRPDTAGPAIIFNHIGAQTTAGPGRGVTHVLSRGRRSTFGTPSGPEFFYEWTSGPSHHDGAIPFYEVFPDPNSTNTDTTYEETGVVNNATFVLGGQILAHNGRILRLCEQSLPFGTRQVNTNERVRYTDPPNSVSLTSTVTDTVFDPQVPSSYSHWGSLTYGELLLIKQYGGAILVEGDPYAPQITRLPSVHSGGTVSSETANCLTGMVYMTDDGPYVWQGGAESQRMGWPGSAIRLSPGNMQSGPQCSVMEFQGLVMFSGGGVWDSSNNSWWNLLSPPGAFGIPMWFSPSLGMITGFYVAFSDLNLTPAINVFTYSANPNRAGQVNTWLSRPINALYDTIDITAIEISAGAVPNVDLTHTFTVTVQFVTIDGTMSAPTTFTMSGSNMQSTMRFRKPCGVRAAFIQPYITITTTGVNYFGISSLTVSYREAGPIGQTQ